MPTTQRKAVDMKWLAISGLVLCATLSTITLAHGWTLWIEHDVTHVYSNKISDASGNWMLQGVFATFEQCSAGKRQSWQRVMNEYDDLSRYPAIASVSSIQDEAVFAELGKRQNVIGGHQNQHFHCLPDSLDPRSRH